MNNFKKGDLAEYYKRNYVPEGVWENLKNAALNVAGSGFNVIGSGIQGVSNLLGGNDTLEKWGNYFSDEADNINRYHGTLDKYRGMGLTDMTLEYLLNPRGGFSDMFSGVGSTLPFLVGGMGAGRVLGGLAKATAEATGIDTALSQGVKKVAEALPKTVADKAGKYELGNTARTFVQYGVPVAVMDAFTNSAEVIEELRRRGYSENEILDVRKGVMSDELLIDLVASGVGANIIAGALPKIGDSALKRSLVSALADAGIEVEQELEQSEATAKALGKELTDEEKAEIARATLIGTLPFAGFGVGTEYFHSKSNTEEEDPRNQPTTKQNQPNSYAEYISRRLDGKSWNQKRLQNQVTLDPEEETTEADEADNNDDIIDAEWSYADESADNNQPPQSYAEYISRRLGGKIQPPKEDEQLEETKASAPVTPKDDSNYTAAENNAWRAAQWASKYLQEKYGKTIPADWIYAQWGHESAHFSSELSKYNNFAGLTQEDPYGKHGQQLAQQLHGKNYQKEYDTVEEFAKDYIDQFINPRLRPEIWDYGNTDFRSFVQALKDTGYFIDSADNYYNSAVQFLENHPHSEYTGEHYTNSDNANADESEYQQTTPIQVPQQNQKPTQEQSNSEYDKLLEEFLNENTEEESETETNALPAINDTKRRTDNQPLTEEDRPSFDWRKYLADSNKESEEIYQAEVVDNGKTPATTQRRQNESLPEGYINVQAEEVSDSSEQQNQLQNRVQQALPAEEIEEQEQRLLPRRDQLLSLPEGKKDQPAGKEVKIYSDNNKEYKARYRIVSADDLITSHRMKNGQVIVNEQYPTQLQPRNRERVAMQDSIFKMAANIIPEQVTDSRNLNQGAPIIRADNVVLNGNGRSLGLITAYKTKRGEKYKRYLIDHADEYGINPEDIKKIKQPILVRELTNEATDEDHDDITTSTTGGSSFSPHEQAINDAKKIKFQDLQGYQSNDTGDLTTPANREYSSKIANKIIPAKDLNQYTDGIGKLNADGYRRIQRALYSIAYDDDRLLDKMTESTNDEIKNISNALLYATPDVAYYKAKVEEGRAHSYPLSETISDAVKLYEQAKRNGEPIEQIRKNNETAMFDKYSDETMKLLQIMDEHNRQSKKLGKFFTGLAKVMNAQKDKKYQTMFNDVEPETFSQIIDRVNKKVFAPQETLSFDEVKPNRDGLSNGYHTENNEDIFEAHPQSFIVDEQGNKDLASIPAEIEEATNGKIKALPIRLRVNEYRNDILPFAKKRQLDPMTTVKNILDNYGQIYQKRSKIERVTFAKKRNLDPIEELKSLFDIYEQIRQNKSKDNRITLHNADDKIYLNLLEQKDYYAIDGLKDYVDDLEVLVWDKNKNKTKSTSVLPNGYHIEGNKTLEEADVHDFIVNKDDERDFGRISEEIENSTNGKVKSAPIRLQVGNQAFGYIHIAKHIKEIQKKGFTNAIDFIHHVINNYDQIYTQLKTNKVGETFTRYVLYCKEDKSHGFMPMDLELKKGSDGYYTITTILPHNKTPNEKQGTLVYDGSAKNPSVTPTSDSLSSADVKKGRDVAEITHANTNVPLQDNLTHSQDKIKSKRPALKGNARKADQFMRSTESSQNQEDREQKKLEAQQKKIESLRKEFEEIEPSAFTAPENFKDTTPESIETAALNTSTKLVNLVTDNGKSYIKGMFHRREIDPVAAKYFQFLRDKRVEEENALKAEKELYSNKLTNEDIQQSEGEKADGRSRLESRGVDGGHRELESSVRTSTGNTVRKEESNSISENVSRGTNGRTRESETNYTIENATSNRSDGQSRSREHGKSDSTGDNQREDKGTVYSDGRRTSTGRLNFHATEDSEIGTGGLKTKFKQNIEAIKLLKQLESENRLANADEQKILSKYNGWGTLVDAFTTKTEWKNENQQLKELLTKAEYETASLSVTDAFYTSPEIIQTIWKGLNKLGFTGGRILDPAMGVGNFFAFMPKEVMSNSNLAGVERELISGGIAKQLYQNANIDVTDYQDRVYPRNFFDLAITNVPFGAVKIPDSKYTYDTNKNYRVHNYYFAKSMDLVRPGGIVAFVTSSGTLQSTDKESEILRNQLANQADLVAAYKLPSSAFEKNAGTSVTTDILIFQKLDPSKKKLDDKSFQSVELIPTADGKNDVYVNKYFVEHPDHILGELTVSKLYTGRGYDAAVQGDINEAINKLNKLVEQLPEIYSPVKGRSENSSSWLSSLNALKDSKKLQGAFSKDNNGHIVQTQIVNDEIKTVPVDKKDEKKIESFIELQQATDSILKAQLNPDVSDGALSKLREELNKRYDKFKKDYGYINNSKNLKLLSADPRYGRVAAIERYQPAVPKKNIQESGNKTDIFFKRTVGAIEEVKHADNAIDALSASISQQGRVNIQYMSQITGMTERQLVKDLGDHIFQNPETNDYETAEEYLSGDVKTKLLYAEEIAKSEPVFAKNVEALRKVIPTDLTEKQVHPMLGSRWIPNEYYEDFLEHLVGVKRAKVNLESVGLYDNYSVDFSRMEYHEQIDFSRNSTKYSTKERKFEQLFSVAINDKTITVYTKDLTTEKPVINQEATQSARDMVKTIRDEFESWIYADEQRKQEILDIYNEKYNRTVERKFDGSMLTFPGLAEETKKKLYPHQKDAIWRIMNGKNTLLAHVVGAGKTYEMVIAAMEMKRIGLIRKPMFLVPNNIVRQFEKEFYQVYPNAKLLVLESKDLPGVKNVLGYDDRLQNGGQKKLETKPKKSKKQETIAEQNARLAKRRTSLNLIATEDWDAIIVNHHMFDRIPMSPEAYTQFYKEDLAMLDKIDVNGRRDRKRIEQAKQNLEAAIKRDIQEELKEICIPFDELGVDQIFVDEADMFKNLQMYTSMDTTSGESIKGISTSKSHRAMDLFVKTNWLSKTRNGGGVTFATGTPISNTLNEIYTMMRYMSQQKLKDLGIDSFDRWAAMFGKKVSSMELSPDGNGYRTITKLNLTNLHSLISMYRDFADIKLIDDLPYLLERRPRLKNGQRTVVSVKPAKGFDQLKRLILDRAEKLRNGRQDKKKEDGEKLDSFMMITNDLRTGSLDLRLLPAEKREGVELYEDNPKTVALAKMVSKKYNETTDVKGAQLIFCDLGVPKEVKTDEDNETKSTEFDAVSLDEEKLYGEIKKQLLKAGIPRNQIAFVHEAKDLTARQKLFEQVNEGDIRIIIGSTEKMGAGTNFQKHLVALHHLDCVWRPRDLEQREGRILRAGNENEEVEIFTYVTEGSYDANMWEKIANKQEMIDSLLRGDPAVEEMEDVSESAADYREIMAMSSSPMERKIAEVKANITKIGSQIKRLTLQASGWQNTIQNNRQQIKDNQDKLNQLQKDIKERTSTKGDDFKITLEGKEYTDRKSADEVLNQIALSTTDKKVKNIGNIGGFNILIRHDDFMTVQRADGTVDEMSSINLMVSNHGSYAVSKPTVKALENAIGSKLDGMKTNFEKTIQINNAEMQAAKDKIKSIHTEIDSLTDKQDKSKQELKELLDAKNKKVDDNQTQLQIKDKIKFSATNIDKATIENAFKDKENIKNLAKQLGATEENGKYKFNDEETEQRFLSVINSPYGLNIAYHGTGADFSTFSLQHIGEGEGTQVHGWGLYFAQNETTSQKYRAMLTPKNNKVIHADGRAFKYDTSRKIWVDVETNEKATSADDIFSDLDMQTLLDYKSDGTIGTRINIISHRKGRRSEYDKQRLEKLKEAQKWTIEKTGGHMFQLNLPSIKFLLDEQKLLNDQTEFIKNQVKKLDKAKPEYFKGKSVSYLNGKEIYDAISKAEGNGNKKIGDKKASEKLLEYGIQGISYEGRRDGRCFVIFNDRLIDILRKYSLKIDKLGQKLKNMKIQTFEGLKSRQKAIQSLAKKLGISVVYFEGDRNLHGYQIGNIAFLNKNSATSLEWTFWHEAFHILKANNKEFYNQIVNKIKKTNPFSKEQIERYRKEIGAEELTDDEIIEEMLADNMSRSARRAGIIDSLRGDRNIFQRLIEFIRDTYQRVKDFFATPTNGLTREQMQVMDEEISRLAKSIDKLANEEHTTESNDGIKYSRTVTDATDSIESFFERLSNKLARKLGLEPNDERIHVVNKNKTYNFTIKNYLVSSPSRINNKTFQKYYELARVAVNKLVRKRNDFTRKLNLSMGHLTQDQKDELFNILLEGDSKQKEYGTLTNEEKKGKTIPQIDNLRAEKVANELNISKPAALAYVKIRRLINAVYHQLNNQKSKYSSELGHIEGYIPHFFHSYFVRVRGNKEQRIIGSGRTQKEAIQIAEEYLKENKLQNGEEIYIEPKMFDFTKLGIDESSYSNMTGDKDFYQMDAKIAKSHGISLKDAKEIHSSKHRFFGNFLQRRGAEGYEQNLDYVLRHYLNSAARYLAMDDFKSQAKTAFEEDFGDFDKDWQGNSKADYIKDYINDINGNPTTLETVFNNALNSNELFKKFVVSNFGERSAISLTNAITQRIGYLTLGAWNISSALLNFSQLINAYGYLGEGSTLLKHFAKYLKPNAKFTMHDLRILSKAGTLNDIGLDSSAGYDQNRNYTSGNPILRRLDKVGNMSMKLFQKTDTLCRIATTLAAYDKAIAEGKSESAAIRYARDVNRDSNFDYSVADAPNIFRRGSVISQLALQFKKYGMKELEVMSDFLSNKTTTKQKLKFWGAYFLAVGLMGVPAGDWLDWLLKDFLNVGSPKDFVQKSIMEATGNSAEGRILGRIAMYGITAPLNINISSRVGLQDVIPKSSGDLMGATASKIYNLVHDLRHNGLGLQAVRDISPGMYNILAAIQGEAPGNRNRVNSKYEDFFDRLIRAIGFKNIDETVESDITRIIYNQRDKLSIDKQKAIDEYLANPTTANAKKLKELNIKPKTVKEERKKKNLTRLNRLTASERKMHSSLLNFAR